MHLRLVRKESTLGPMTQIHAIANLEQTGTRPVVSRLRAVRWLWAGFGLVCVGLGAVGVVVPGLPTTVFLMIACWAFAKSCPPLERWVLGTRLFAPYSRYLDGRTPMPRRAKAIAIGLMWTSVSVSVWVLVGREASVWVHLAVIVSALVGTVFIARWKPRALR